MPSTSSPTKLELAAERWLPFAVDRVWEQCTSKRGLEGWWSPEDLRTTVKRLDLRPGGELVMTVRYVPAMLGTQSDVAFRAAGVPISFSLRGRIRELEHHRRLVLELMLTLDRGGAGIESVTELDFEPIGSGTKVRIAVAGRSERHRATLGKSNLEGQLDRLGRALGHPSESPA